MDSWECLFGYLLYTRISLVSPRHQTGSILMGIDHPCRIDGIGLMVYADWSPIYASQDSDGLMEQCTLWNVRDIPGRRKNLISRYIGYKWPSVDGSWWYTSSEGRWQGDLGRGQGIRIGKRLRAMLFVEKVILCMRFDVDKAVDKPDILWASCLWKAYEACFRDWNSLFQGNVWVWT
jgi:hypothetical protein